MALFWHTVKRNIAISTRDFECCNLNEKLQKWSWASKLPFFVVRKQSLLSRGPSLKGWSNQHKRKCVRQSKNSSPVERSLYQGIQVTQCTAQGVSKNLTGTLALQRVHWAQETVKCGTGLLFIICKKSLSLCFQKTISMTWALGSVLPFAMFQWSCLSIRICLPLLQALGMEGGRGKGYAIGYNFLCHFTGIPSSAIRNLEPLF